MPDSYDALLTGAPDGEDDFVYILKSYNGIHYSELTSNLTFQFPRQPNDINAIVDRPNGEILLRKNGIELFRGALTTFNFFEGSTNKTFSVGANYATTESINENIELAVHKIDVESDGKRIFTISGNHDFRPLDSLIYNSETIEIDKVTINIIIGNTYMKLREA